MRALALIAAYNEERFIGICLEHLFSQGIEVYLCDNDSTDGTVAIAERYLGAGLRAIERIPRDGTFRWREILRRKEALASELEADWFLHLDPTRSRWDRGPALDVYFCASRTDGTPNPCLEAAACGLPVVTTRVGNMPEFIRDGENGFLVERDAADIAAKLRRLRDDPGLRERLGRTARATAEQWDWGHQAARYDAMFREVLGDG